MQICDRPLIVVLNSSIAVRSAHRMNPKPFIPSSNPPRPSEWIEALCNDNTGRAHRAFLGTAEQNPPILQCARPACIDGQAWAAAWRVFDQTKAGNVDWYLQQANAPWRELMQLSSARDTEPSVANFIHAALDDDVPGLINLFYSRAISENELTDVPAWVMIYLAHQMVSDPVTFDACVPGNEVFIQQLYLSKTKYVGIDDGEGYMETNHTGLAMGKYLDEHEVFSLLSRFGDAHLRSDECDFTELISSAIELGLLYPRAMHEWCTFFSYDFSLEQLLESWPAEVRSFYETAMALHGDERTAVASAWAGHRAAALAESLSGLTL